MNIETSSPVAFAGRSSAATDADDGVGIDAFTERHPPVQGGWSRRKSTRRSELRLSRRGIQAVFYREVFDWKLKPFRRAPAGTARLPPPRCVRGRRDLDGLAGNGRP